MKPIVEILKISLLSITLVMIHCTGFSQMLYFHYNDSVRQVCGDTVLSNFLLDEKLRDYASTQDSISFFIIDENDCYITSVKGIPLCTTCGVAANKVMQTAYRLAFIENFIIQGSCWDFVNAVFTGIASDSIQKKDIYSEKKAGPYTTINELQPGDWVYHVNYEYNRIEHSAIFIGWADYEKGLAIVLDYVGLNRRQPAKFGEHNLNSVYAIFRMEKVD